MNRISPYFAILTLIGVNLIFSACASQEHMVPSLFQAPPATPTILLAPEYPTSTHTPRPAHPTPTSTPPTPTMAPGGLSGVTFFDYDGDGLQNENEPGIKDVLVCVSISSKDRCARSSADGSYVLVNLPLGTWQVQIESPSKEPANAFRYFNPFKDWATIQGYSLWGNWIPTQRLPKTELQPIEDPIQIDVSAATKLDIPLMQGYFTDIFACGDRSRVQTFQAYDLDRRDGWVRNYDEVDSRQEIREETALLGDNHFAIDWGNLNNNIIGIPLYSPANGIVVFSGEGQTWNGLCRVVNLVHPETGDSSGIVHLEKALVRDGQQVLRGQLLGTLGMSCTTWPHVHFFFRLGHNRIEGKWEGIDPYRDITDPESFTYWTKDNEPMCPEFLKGSQK